MLRPKTDEDLKSWKEKLANGIKDGTHKYIVKNTFTVSGVEVCNSIPF
jgi:hypothetical protein